MPFSCNVTIAKCFQILKGTDQEIGPRAKSYPLLVFLNKVLLKHSQVHLFTYFSDHIPVKMVTLGTYDRDC